MTIFLLQTMLYLNIFTLVYLFQNDAFAPYVSDFIPNLMEEYTFTIRKKLLNKYAIEYDKVLLLNIPNTEIAMITNRIRIFNPCIYASIEFLFLIEKKVII